MNLKEKLKIYSTIAIISLSLSCSSLEKRLSKIFEKNTSNTFEHIILTQGYISYNEEIQDTSPSILTYNSENPVYTNIIKSSQPIKFSIMPDYSSINSKNPYLSLHLSEEVKSGRGTSWKEECFKADYEDLIKTTNNSLVTYSYTLNPSSIIGNSGVYWFEWRNQPVKNILGIRSDKGILKTGHFTLKE